MALPLMIFPATALSRSAFFSFWPWGQPLLVMEPPGVASAAAPDWLPDGALEFLRPPATSGADPRALESLRRAWEEWLGLHQGSGQAEALKLGLALADDEETKLSLKRELRGFGHPAPQPAAGLPPEAADELFLLLLHRQDVEAGEMEELLVKTMAAQRAMDLALGKMEEDHTPAEYEQPLTERLLPRAQWSEPEEKLSRRLAAWAGLARRLPEGQGGWLATPSLETAQILMERAGQAQEAGRLTWPDLGQVEAQIAPELSQAGFVREARARLATLLTRLAGEPWSPELKQALAGQARELSQDFTAGLRGMLPELGPQERSLGLLAFPGLSQGQVLELMQGQEPGIAQAQGSCPLLAAW